uniref:Pepsin inhibitor-3-like repeated domain-containing protein n=1 Tax=Acrobeloides nanus TaxID=290746 RepID=A0A914CEU7_9BILA
MFRILTFLVLASVAFASESRAKRYYYGGGGRCIVTGTKLFINGIYDHDLSSSEQTEFQQYQTAFKTYQQQEAAYQAAIAKQHQSIWDKWGSQVGNWWNSVRHNNVSTTTQVPTTTITPPTAPSRPAFCNDNVTTQYYFNDCVIQNNKVYIGQTYARDLTSDEVNQLNTYNQQTQAYQEQLNQRYGLWGKIKVLPMFLTVNGSLSTTPAPATTPTAVLQPPTQPSFCSTIYNIVAPVYSNYGTYDYGTYDSESNGELAHVEAIPVAAAVGMAPANE